MQADEFGLRTHLEGAGQAIPAGGHVDDLVLGDGLLEGSGVVGNAVTLGAVLEDAHPGFHRRKGAEFPREFLRGLGDRSHLADLADGRFGVQGVIGHSVREILDIVGLPCTGDGLLALLVIDSNGDIAAGDILQGYHIHRYVLHGDFHGRVGNVLEQGALDVDDVPGVVIALIGDGGVLHMHADEGGAQVLAQDGRLLLAFEIGVDHRQRPTRRRPAGDDAVLASEEPEVFDFVAQVPDAREGVLPQLEVDMAEETVLGEMALDGDGLGIALPDPEIDVGQGAVEGTGACVGRPLAFAGEPAREPDHIIPLVLIAGRIVRQVDHRAFLAVPDHADVGGDQDGLRDPVFPFGDVQDAEVVLDLDVIDGLLEGIRDIRFPVCLEPVVLRREIEGARILRTEGIDGAGSRLLRCEGRHECDREQKDA